MQNPREISISTDTFIRALLVVVGALLIFLIRDILLILLVAIVIAATMTPAVDFLDRFNFPRVLSVSLVYSVVLTGFGLFLYFFVPIIISEITGFLTTLPEYSSEISPEVLEDVEVAGELSLEEVITNMRVSIGAFGDNVFGTIGIIFGGVFNFLLIFAIAFYISVQKNGVARFINYVTPVKYTDYALDLWERSQTKISKWFQGMSIAGLVVGVAVYIGLLILGVPYAFFFALLAALLNFIPIIGPTLGAVPAIAVGLAEGGLLIGVLTTLLFIVIQSLEGNFLYPVIVGRAVGVSPIAIILAIGIGSKLGGFLGVLLAVPMSAIFMELWADTRKVHKAQNKAKKDVQLPPSDTHIASDS